MYSMYMSWLVNLASSSVAIRSWNCLEVFFFSNGIPLGCHVVLIWCFSPYTDSINIKVLVKNLYIVFGIAMGLWFVSCKGFLFLYSSMVRVIFHDMKSIVVYSSERRIGKTIYGSLLACFLGMC